MKNNKLIVATIITISIVGIVFIFKTIFITSEFRSKNTAPTGNDIVPKSSLPATPITQPPPKFELPPPPPKITKTIEARRGDTFVKLLLRAGANRLDAHRATRALDKSYRPQALKEGQLIRVNFQTKSWDVKSSYFIGFEFNPDINQILKVRRTGTNLFTLQKIKVLLKTVDARISGTIDTSLYLAAVKAGMAPSSLVNLTRLFSWDVDFQRDIRKNDKFDILIERLHQKNGQFKSWGQILYAELILSGKPIRLYRVKTKRYGVEYFDDQGRSAKKALMKTPIDGARLSSGYGRRRHPILGYTKVHRGVDFAAPRGTPIYAAGNGVIRYVGRKGAYGKYIKIRHNSTYSTAYAHLQNFSRNIRKGRRVTQGQVIGYVGSTGRSTGPHLHYEIIVNGRQINPLRLRLPSGRNLRGNALKSFINIRDNVNERLSRFLNKNLSQ